MKLLTVPYRLLYPAILLFCAVGVYTVNNTDVDVSMTAFFGFLGVLFVKLGCEPARPCCWGFVLGPMMEENLRARCFCRAAIRPSSSLARSRRACSQPAVLLVLIITLPNIRAKREEAFQEEGA